MLQHILNNDALFSLSTKITRILVCDDAHKRNQIKYIVLDKINNLRVAIDDMTAKERVEFENALLHTLKFKELI